MSYTTILFDLDGTIANTNDVILQTISDTLEHESGRSWERAELLPYWGMRLRDQLVILYPAINLEQAIPYYRRRYNDYSEALLTEFPGVRNALADLQRRFRLGVVTSKKREAALMTLRSLQYEQFFEIVVAEEDTKRHKPDPDPLIFAMRQLGVTVAETIYVGDNPDDMRAAKAAGMRAVAVGWCLRPKEEIISVNPDIIIENAMDLPRWLSQSI